MANAQQREEPTVEELTTLRQHLVLKTSDEWYRELVITLAQQYPGISDNFDRMVIVSADGWRDLAGDGRVVGKYWHHVPITKHEFLDRFGQCTLRTIGDGEDVAEALAAPYARPYDDAHLAYIWRASQAIRQDCARTCGTRCQGQHDAAMEAFCEREKPHDGWDISLAYELCNHAKAK